MRKSLPSQTGPAQQKTASPSLAANAVLNTVRTLIGIIFPIITYPYISRVLGTEQLGIYNFSSSIVSYAQLIAALGIGTYAVREGARIRGEQQAIDRFAGEIFTINMLSTLAAYVFLGLLLILPFMAHYRAVTIILGIDILLFTLGCGWVLTVYEDFLYLTIRSFLMQVAALILLFLLVRTPADLNRYALVLLLAHGGSNLFGFFRARQYCRIRLTRQIDWKRHLGPILIIFSASVATTIYVGTDATMLGILRTDAEVGIYGTAMRIYAVVKNVLMALLLVLVPRFSQLFAKDDKEGAKALLSKVFHILTALMLPLCTGLFLCSRDIVWAVSGEAYTDAAAPLRLLAIAVLFAACAGLFVQCILIPVRNERAALFAAAVPAAVNIIFNLLLIPKWGIRGAAFTTIVAEIVSFGISGAYAKAYFRITGLKKCLPPVLLGTAVIAAVCLLARQIGNAGIRLCVSVAASVLLYALVLTMFRHPVMTDLKALLQKGK